MIARRCRNLLLALLLVLPWPLLAQVQASLDRSQVELGQTVTLNLRVDGSASLGVPDLSALQPDFDILGSSSSTQVSIINGQRSVQVTYGVALRPKRLGSLLIPPLKLAAGSTPALKLEVVPPRDAPPGAAGNDKAQFLEVSVQPGQAYVGQQLLYTARLYYSTNLSGGSLEDPQAPGVEVRRLGDDINYSAERNGRQYRVVERRYALIPQRPGDIRIAPISFQGEAVDLNDPDSFFGDSAPVSVSSAAERITVKPAPAAAAKTDWLPARQLSLSLDGWPAGGQAPLGQPINLRMTLQAGGLPAEALPALSLPALDGATVYPDKPSNSTGSDGQWLIGKRQQDYAVVPTRPGTLHIPEITLQWWNVQTDRLEQASIPAHDLTIVGTATTPHPPASSAAGPAVAPATASRTPDATVATARPSPREWLVGGLVLLLVLAGLWLGWRRRRRGKARAAAAAQTAPLRGDAAPPRGEVRQQRERFLALAAGNDPAAQGQALLAWARAERPALALLHLGALAQALASPEQQAAIAALQQARYGQGAHVPPLAPLFAEGLRWREATTTADCSPLPPLYPFTLR